MIYRTFLHAGCLVAMVLFLPTSMLAGHAFVFATTDSYNNVVATAITDAEYQMGGIHTAYATAKITGPDGRVVQSSASDENTVSVNAMIAIDNDDGRYITLNFDPREYCPVAHNLYYLAGARDDEIIPPFLKINSTQVSPATIAKKNGTSMYTLTVGTSTNCTGNVTIQAMRTRNPNDIDATIQGGGEPHAVIAYQSYLMQHQASAAFNFTVKTSNVTIYSGALFVSPEVYGKPSSCGDRTVASVKTPKQITVQ